MFLTRKRPNFLASFVRRFSTETRRESRSSRRNSNFSKSIEASQTPTTVGHAGKGQKTPDFSGFGKHPRTIAKFVLTDLKIPSENDPLIDLETAFYDNEQLVLKSLKSKPFPAGTYLETLIYFISRIPPEMLEEAVLRLTKKDVDLLEKLRQQYKLQKWSIPMLQHAITLYGQLDRVEDAKPYFEPLIHRHSKFLRFFRKTLDKPDQFIKVSKVAKRTTTFCYPMLQTLLGSTKEAEDLRRGKSSLSDKIQRNQETDRQWAFEALHLLRCIAIIPEWHSSLWSLLISAYAKVENVDYAWRVYREMQDHRISPYAYVNLLWALMRANRFQDCVNVVTEISSRWPQGEVRVYPNRLFLYSVLSLARDAEAKDLHLQSRDRQLQYVQEIDLWYKRIVDSELYNDIDLQNAVIQAYAIVGESQKAQAIYDEMMKYASSGTKKSPVYVANNPVKNPTKSLASTLKHIIRAHIRHGDVDKAVQVFLDSSVLNVEPYVKVWIELLPPLLKTNRTLAKDLVVKISSQYQSITPWTQYFYFLALNGQLAQVLTCLDEVKAAGLKPTEEMYNNILMAASKSPAVDPTMIRDLLDNVLENVSDPKPETFNNVLQSYHTHDAPSTDFWNLVLELMPRKNVKPNIVSFNTMFNAFARRANPQDWEALNQTFEATGLEPNERTWSAKLLYEARVNGTTNLEQVFQQIPNPNPFHYDLLLREYGKQGNTEKCEYWFDKMLKEKVYPTGSNWANLIKAYNHKDCDKAKDIFYKMLRQRGLHSPSDSTFSVLLDGFKFANRFDLVKQVWTDYKQHLTNSRRYPNPNDYVSYVEALVKAEDYDLALKVLFEEMLEDHVRPLDKLLMHMASTLPSDRLGKYDQDLMQHYPDMYVSNPLLQSIVRNRLPSKWSK